MGYYQPCRLVSSAGIPGILSVCVEARLVGLKFYSPAFTTQCIASPGDLVALESLPAAYINWEIDIVCGGDQHQHEGESEAYRSMHDMLRGESSIKRLAFDSHYPSRDRCLQRIIEANRIEEIIVYTTNGIPKSSQDHEATAPAYDPDHSVAVWEDGLKPMIAVGQLTVDVADTPEQAASARMAFKKVCELVTTVEADVREKVSKGNFRPLWLADWERPVVKLKLVVQPQSARRPLLSEVVPNHFGHEGAAVVDSDSTQ